MHFELGKPMISVLEGKPARLAGEWPGSKPCRFGESKRIIKPITEQRVFDCYFVTSQGNGSYSGPQNIY